MSGAAWMFPGQGSQKAEMASQLDHRREIFETSASSLNLDLEKLCVVDPRPIWYPESLQPALFATSLAAARGLAARGLRPRAAVGHSLGEYSALAAAGVFSAEDGLRLVSVRARAMSEAARRRPGGMAAVIGLDPATVAQICSEIEGVWVANFNSPQQIVISGKDEPLADAAEKARAAGASRVVRLDVPMAGHSPLMESACPSVAEVLDEIEMKPPEFDCYSVVDARPHTDPVEIAELLVAAIVSPVRFTETIVAMNSDGIEEFVEVGPGKVLQGLVRRIDSGLKPAGAGSDQEIEALASNDSKLQTAGTRT